MSIQENKAIVQRFYDEVINRGSQVALTEIVSPEYREHGAPPDQPPGLEGFLLFLQMVSTAFPDIQVTVEDLLAEGDKVAARLTVRGTHLGILMDTIQPTGRQATWTGIDILQIENGKIIGRWSERNLLSLVRQLGAIS